MTEKADYKKITMHDNLAHLKEYFLALINGLAHWIYEAPFIIKNLKKDYKKYNMNLFLLLWNAFIKYQLLGFFP